MPEIYFYHLEDISLDRVLPDLLEKTLSRDWRALIRFGSRSLRDRMDEHLWTYRPDYFLPHGLIEDGFLEYQPIILSYEESDCPSGYDLYFLVSGAKIEMEDRAYIDSYIRLIFIFDGHDENELSWARAYYRSFRDAGYKIVYWQRHSSGRWQKSLETKND